MNHVSSNLNRNRPAFGRIIRISFGVVLFALAMIYLGIVFRTLWAGAHGQVLGSPEMTDFFVVALLAVVSLSLIGYEKLAAALMMEFVFSLTLGSLIAFYLLAPTTRGDAASMVVVYALAFIGVFVFGQKCHWSKSFALGGMLLVFIAGLGCFIAIRFP